MTIEEMKQKKKEFGYTYEQIAELSGLPVGTVQKALGGITKTPRYDTLQALEKVFRQEEKYTERVGETQASYGRQKKQGEYTLMDYYAIPEDCRAELIDGVIYEMAAPESIHQLISGELFLALKNYVRKNNGKCVVQYAPVDVQLDRDDKTMVQPDILITCDRSKIKKNLIYGAPDFIVEILSPSTRKTDIHLKTTKYSNAGVREYWLVDPDNRRVMVYDFVRDDFPFIYGFDDQIPVRIFENECVVDFAEISDYIEFLHDEEIEGDV